MAWSGQGGPAVACPVKRPVRRHCRKLANLLIAGVTVKLEFQDLQLISLSDGEYIINLDANSSAGLWAQRHALPALLHFEVDLLSGPILKHYAREPHLGSHMLERGVVAKLGNDARPVKMEVYPSAGCVARARPPAIQVGGGASTTINRLLRTVLRPMFGGSNCLVDRQFLVCRRWRDRFTRGGSQASKPVVNGLANLCWSRVRRDPICK